MKPNTNVPEFWYNITQAGAFANTDQTFGQFGVITYGDNGRYLAEATWLGGRSAGAKFISDPSGSVAGQVFTNVLGYGGDRIIMATASPKPLLVISDEQIYRVNQTPAIAGDAFRYNIEGITGSGTRVQVIFDDGSPWFSANNENINVIGDNLRTEIEERKAEDTKINQRITDLFDTELRIVGISNWEQGTGARTIQVALYPGKPIAANTTLNFTVGGIAHTASSGPSGIDLHGSLIGILVNETNAAIINVSAISGNVPVDWVFSRDITYHGWLDYIPASTGGGGGGETRTIVYETSSGVESDDGPIKGKGNADDIPWPTTGDIEISFRDTGTTATRFVSAVPGYTGFLRLSASQRPKSVGSEAEITVSDVWPMPLRPGSSVGFSLANVNGKVWTGPGSVSLDYFRMVHIT